jgi:lipoprotein-releasing system permease protein
MYKLFLTFRYLRKRRIAYFAVAAVTLCVMMVLTVMSVMGGWLDMVRNRARGLLGDVIVDNGSYSGFPLYEEFISEIKTWPEIAAATPVLYTYGLVTFPRSTQNGYVVVVGVRLTELYQVNGFHSGLYYENHFPDTTTFESRGQPVMGLDLDSEPMRMKDGRELAALALPPPYQEALSRARSAAGGARPDSDSTETELQELLAEAGRPLIPGRWELNDPGESGPPLPEVIGDPAPGVILGRDLVADREPDGRYRRKYPLGEALSMTLVPWSDAGDFQSPVRPTFRYVDDSRTGIYEIDSRHAYVDFDYLQKLLHLDATDRVDREDPEKVIGRVPARCSQIQIKLKPGIEAGAICARLTQTYRRLADEARDGLSVSEVNLLARVEAQTWEQSQAHIIAPVEKERMLVTILFGIISLVAVALILCILYMIVLQKTKDIGILKAVGASSKGVAAIWLTYGAAVGVVGGTLGLILGTLFVTNINQVQDFLIWAFNFRVWDLRVYSFDEIPHSVSGRDALVIFLFAVGASTLGALGAAWRAGSMEPVGAIRHE